MHHHTYVRAHRLALIGLLWPAWARAADEELLFAEIPKVYAASRREEPISHAPAAVTIITRDDIVKYGYRTVGQALAGVAGFYLTDDRGYTVTTGVRGLGVPGASNLRVLFLLNGLPVVDKYWTAFNSEITPDMLDAIDRIEVVKGPGSTLYGSNALIAIINIITRKGADVNGATVSAEVGANPSGRGVFTFGKLFPNGLDLFLSGHFNVDEGESTIDFGNAGKARHAEQSQLGSIFATARYQDFSVQAWYSDRQKEIPAGLFGSVAASDRNRAEDRWALVEVRWEHEFDENTSWMMRAYVQSFADRSQLLYQGPGYSSLAIDGNIDRWVGYETQFNFRPIERDQLTLGALFEHHWMSLQGHNRNTPTGPNFPVTGGSDRLRYVAAYAQNEFQILPALSLTLGVRVDHFENDLDFDRTGISPRAAVVWNVTRRTTVKLLYGQAFRAPSEFEREFPAQDDIGPRHPNIGSEKISTYEFVLEQDFRQGLFGRLSVFHNDTENLIDVANPYPLIFDNVHDVHTTGLEMEFTKTFACGVRGFVNGTWQNSEFHGGPEINSPAWLGNAGIIWPILGDKLSVALRQNFVSARETRIPGHATEESYPTDLTISSTDWIQNWAFNLGIQNLLDQHYKVPGALDTTLETIPQKGRTILFRATYRF